MSSIEDLEFRTPQSAFTRKIEHIVQDLADARAYSPLDAEQMDYWKMISKRPNEVQEILDRSETYQEMLRARGLRK